ncbi:MAG: trypsin-like peptidase domain-containing protein, partial [Candidatus Baltobacteraceae bacterium]
KYQARASGSGFVYKSDGEIVTNAHVVTPPNNGTISKLEVVFADGDRIQAHIVSTNIAADLAIIKVDGYAKLPPPVELANSDTLEQGQWAIAIGEPIGLQKTVTVGVVSAFNRNEPIQNESGQAITFKGLLQTSAPINPGNSGGPLVDLQGKVIGINQSTAQSVQGIGFAIPANTVRQIVASLEQHPGIHQGTGSSYIGVGLRDLNPGLRRQIGGYQGPGVAVIQVFPDTPADTAGLNPGDVIYRVDGKDITNNQELIRIISGAKPGQTLNVDTWSQGIKKLVSIKVGEKPAGYGQPQPQQGP